MADNIGIIQQNFPPAATAAQLYAIPNGFQLVVSSLVINNQGAALDNVWVSFRKGGAADADSQYYMGAGPGQAGGGVPVGIANPFVATLGLTFGVGDQIWVKSLLGTTSFQIFGDLINS